MNITLIGMPGVGKSFIGKKLAGKLGYKFVDVDTLMEKETGLSLKGIKDKFGEEGFIKIEQEEVLKLVKNKPDKKVISPGGSVIYSDDAMDSLKKVSKIIYLKDDLNRIKNRLNKEHQSKIVWFGANSFEELLKKRERLYEKYADFIIEISVFDENRIVEEILKKVGMKR